MKNYVKEHVGEVAQRLVNPGVDVTPVLDAVKDVLEVARRREDEQDNSAKA